MKLLRPNVHSAAGDPLDLGPPDNIRPTPRWDDPAIFPSNEGGRVAKYRRHQSWYRETVLHVPPGRSGHYEALGSYLDEGSVEADPSLNFLTAEAEAHAIDRAAVVKAEGGALDPVRLLRNMLSSMPLCFNLFGSLRGEPAFLDLFQTVFDPAATRIVDVLCEYAPQPPSEFLGDRTAFDAVVFYETDAGPRFLGIETKYTESFSEREYESPRYDEVTEASGWFKGPSGGASSLKGRKSNQLWRNMMLAAALERAGKHGEGAVAVVALDDDPGAAAAIEALNGQLTRQSRLRKVPIQTILAAASRSPELAPWSAAFRLRYVE